MGEYVQGIVIKDSKVLKVYKNNRLNEVEGFFIGGEIKNKEGEADAVLRIFKERLNISPRIIFKLNRDMYNNVFTFLIDIGDEKLDIDSLNNEENKDFHRYSFESLEDGSLFSSKDKFYFKCLLETCVDRDYNPEWLNSVESIALTDQTYKYLNQDIKRKIRMKQQKKYDIDAGTDEKIQMIIAALLIGVIFKIFFKDRYIGISYPIFMGILTAVYFLMIKGRSKNKLIGCMTLIASFLLGINLSIHSNPVLNGINLIIIPMLMTSAFMLIRYDGFKWYRLSFIGQLINRITALTFENTLKPFRFINESIKCKEKVKINSTQKNILKGLLISIPLVFILLALLSSADMVFGYYLSNIFKNIPKLELGNIISDVILIIIVFLYTFSYLWSFKYSSINFMGEDNAIKKYWEPTVILTIISVINIIYLAFSIIQFSYLYGGRNMLPNGFTYAEYARRGFFELAAVTLINFTMLICCIKYVKRDNKGIKTFANLSFTLLVLFTFNMLFSAHYKMFLYEKTYGYTYLRVFVHVFLALLFILFVISLVSIWVDKVPLAKLSIIATLMMYILLNYANVDSFIARKNIERFNETGKIDIYYLTHLSYDAIPQIQKLLDSPKLEQEYKQQIDRDLKEIQIKLSKQQSWLEFNYSKFMAQKTIE